MLAERFKTLFYFTINKSFVFVIDFVGRLHPKYFEEDTFSELSQTSLVISNNTLIIKLSASILRLIVIKCIFLIENIPVTEAFFLIIVYCLKTYSYIFDL